MEAGTKENGKTERRRQERTAKRVRERDGGGESG